MKIKIITILFILFGCHNSYSDQKLYNNQNNLNQLIDAYIFLSENHDLLHIMMGEYEGSPKKSYNEYRNKIQPLRGNNYIKPILFGLDNITIKNEILENADKFDALVDYYQMGMQIMIEGILKGYGYNEMPKNSKEYREIKQIKFN